jgi:hypothetical protein
MSVTVMVQEINQGALGSHLCSYMCWASQGTGDPRDLCYFPGDENAPVGHHLCDVAFTRSESLRYPTMGNQIHAWVDK